MEKETIENIICGIIALFIVIGLLAGFFLFIHYMFDKTEKELNAKIMDNINLSKPFNKVVTVESNLLCCSENWYSVSILVTTDEYPDPQWIYDFRYNINTDELFYDGNIEGIGVVNN